MRLEQFVQTRLGRGVLEAALRYFRAELVGQERIPREGGALLVANHGPFGFDALVLGALLERLGRIPYWLADRNMWRSPGWPALLEFLRAVPGEHEAAEELLARGELVVVYPGGIRDSYKLSRDRHRLLWRDRSGFARLAMRARVPIVPLAAQGVDDMYRVVAREPLLGRLLFGDARYNLPIALGRWGTLVPRPARVVIHALPVIEPHGDPSNQADVRALRDRVQSAVQAKLDET